jgi:hypothetical protein
VLESVTVSVALIAKAMPDKLQEWGADCATCRRTKVDWSRGVSGGLSRGAHSAQAVTGSSSYASPFKKPSSYQLKTCRIASGVGLSGSDTSLLKNSATSPAGRSMRFWMRSGSRNDGPACRSLKVISPGQTSRESLGLRLRWMLCWRVTEVGSSPLSTRSIFCRSAP